MNKRHVFLTLFACLAVGDAIAQLSRKELGLAAEMTFPVDDYRWHFDSGLLYHLSYANAKKPKGEITNWFVFKLAYGQQRPVADTLFYIVNDTEYGFLVYTNRQLLLVSVGMRWDFSSSSAIQPFIGFDLGGFIDAYNIVQRDPDFNIEGGATNNGVHLSPFGGIKYVSDNGFGVFVRGRYAFGLSLSEKYHQIAFGMGLSYAF